MSAKQSDTRNRTLDDGGNGKGDRHDRSVLAVTREAAPLTPESTEFESLAAAYTLAQMGAVEAAPEALKAALIRDGEQYFASRDKPASIDARQQGNRPATGRAATRPSRLPWIAAAAMFALAIIGWMPHITTLLAPPDPTEPAAPSVAATTATQPSVGSTRPQYSAQQVATLAPAAAAASDDLRGAVHWNQQDQSGYLTVSGLAVNDPAREQYQLWVVDGQRGATPVDGGVFNARSSTDIRIPFKPSLTVYDPQAFAITLERPGGVVVSDQQRLVALGAVSG